MNDYRSILESAYAAFNARDIDAALAVMHPDVDWANGMEGGRVLGHAAVRDYTIEDGLVRWMEIRDVGSAGRLADV